MTACIPGDLPGVARIEEHQSLGMLDQEERHGHNVWLTETPAKCDNMLLRCQLAAFEKEKLHTENPISQVTAQAGIA